MRAVVQRVKHASIRIENEEEHGIHRQIGEGLLVLLGIDKEDTEKDLDYIVKKIIGLRIFSDSNGKMNWNVQQINGSIALVSQFTLYGDARKGMRPSFDSAASGEIATALYEEMIKRLQDSSVPIVTGEFGAHMQVELCNDGPVTILLDSNKLF